MPYKDPDKQREYQTNWARKSRAKDKPQVLDSDAISILNDIRYLLIDIRFALSHLAEIELVDDKFTEGFDKSSTESVEPDHERVRQGSTNGSTGFDSRVRQSSTESVEPVEPVEPKKPDGNQRFRPNGFNGSTKPVEPPIDDDVVDEEDIKTNNTINDNDKNAQASGARAGAGAGAQADRRARIAQAQQVINSVQPQPGEAVINPVCPYETILGDAGMELFAEKMKNHGFSVSGKPWVRKTLRHAYQVAGDATDEQLRAAIMLYFEGMRATQKTKGISSIDGWTRKVLPNHILEVKDSG